MAEIPKLTSIDLIAENPDNLDSVYYSTYLYPRILRPMEIPVYPRLLGERFAYSTDFLKEVLEKVYGTIRDDVEVIENTLGVNLEIELALDHIRHKDKKFLFKELEIISRRKLGETGISCAVGSTSSSTGENVIEKFAYDDGHPLPKEKAEIYAFSNESWGIELGGWRTHNLTYQGFPFELIARNFAIEFNNLGLERI